jgi:hypothetical protein
MAAPTGSSISIEQITRCLEDVIRGVEQKNKTMAEALRNDARLQNVVGREIYFITSEFMKGRFEKPQPKAAIDQAFSDALGQPVTVHFISENMAAPLPAGTPNPVSGNDQSADTNFDALLKVAIEELGGHVAP